MLKPEQHHGQALTLTMLVAAGLVNFLDRSSLSIALNSIRAEMHLSATQIGGLIAAFSLAYGFSQLPVGPLLDRFGAWRIVGAGLGVWSLAQLFTGFVTGVRGFLPMRVLLGMGEAPFFPGAVKLVRERFTVEERGRAMGAVNISSAIGQGLAPPLLTAIMLWLGWRSMFMLIGGIGTALAVLWFAVQRFTAPAAAPAPEVPARLSFENWLSLFGQRSMWGMMLGFGGINYTAWFYIAWLPAYLQDERGVSVLHSGWLAALPFLGGSAGMYVSGLLADIRIGRGREHRFVHMSQIVSGMVFSALFTLAAPHVAGLGGAVACMSSALFCIHFAGTSAWGYVHSASDRTMVATVGSIQNFGSFLIASVAPFATGRILDLTHAYGSAFALCAAVSLAGAACYLFVVRQRTVVLAQA